MKQLMTFNVNGMDYTVAAEPSTTLADLLRLELGFTGVKKGCDDGDCGACTVLIDGKTAASCTTLAVEAQGRKIVTIEGVKQGYELHPVQKAFVDCFAFQCGFCTPGMILSTIALLSENPDPTENEIRDYLRGNLCRCTGYNKIIDAVHTAKKYIAEQQNA